MKKAVITMGIALGFVIGLAACSGTQAAPPTVTNVPIAVIETQVAPTNEATEAATAAALTTLIAPNPTAVESGITPEEAVIAANIDAADVAAGEHLFVRALIPTCISCHTNDSTVRQTAPSLVGFSEIAARRVAGESAYTYAYNSIRYANEHVVEGFSSSVMPSYDGILIDQEVYQLIAYIWTLDDE